MSIKTQRALRRIAPAGPDGLTLAMLKAVPDSVIAALASAQLADLLRAMASVSIHSKDLADFEACANGCVWDAERQALREII